MIPETKNACQATESTPTAQEVEDKAKSQKEEDVGTSLTAWKRYEMFVSMLETRGLQYNKQSTIEAMFRGNDLVYVNHR